MMKTVTLYIRYSCLLASILATMLETLTVIHCVAATRRLCKYLTQITAAKQWICYYQNLHLKLF